VNRPDRPAWLVRQENGAIAEARTRALLLDRFWILERSVDIDGADFIIQRRLTTQSLLDSDPPRLGFVQAKYYQDASTTQYIHREYVLDKHGRPRSEFFLMCHTGLEDSARAFFLSAADIVDNFEATSESHSKPNRFELPGRRVLEQRFEVLDRRRILEQAEQALRNADFVANRYFMSWALPSLETRGGPIRSEYMEKIDNWWGDIPKEFESLREKARQALWNIEEAGELLHAIATADDPQIALEKAEDLHIQYGRSVPISDDLYDPDFSAVVQHHRSRYEQLKSAGLLGAHAALRRDVKARIMSDVVPRMPLAPDMAYLVSLRYTSDTLALAGLDSRFATADTLDLPKDTWSGEARTKESGILQSEPGNVRAFILPGRYGYEQWKRGKSVPDERSWTEKFDRIAEYLTSEIMSTILAMRLDARQASEAADGNAPQ
jgi:hypothetical protein